MQTLGRHCGAEFSENATAGAMANGVLPANHGPAEWKYEPSELSRLHGANDGAKPR
jgi:hypothetical protein